MYNEIQGKLNTFLMIGPVLITSVSLIYKNFYQITLEITNQTLFF